MDQDERRRMMYRIEKLREMMSDSSISEQKYEPMQNTNPVRRAPSERKSSGVSYTSREDQKLVNSVKNFGKKWEYISRHAFNGERTGDSLRNRYNLLAQQRPSTPHPTKHYPSKKIMPRSKSLPNIKNPSQISKRPTQPIRRPTQPAKKPTQSSFNGQKQPYSKNGRRAFVHKIDENGRKKKYRVYQGPRGGFLFTRGGRDVKLNHTNGFVYEK